MAFGDKKFYDGHMYPTELGHLPTEPYNAVLTEEYSCADDGYGGQSCGNELKLMVFETPKDMQLWVEGQVKSQATYGKKKFRLVRINPIEVQVTTTLTFKE